MMAIYQMRFWLISQLRRIQVLELIECGLTCSTNKLIDSTNAYRCFLDAFLQGILL